MKPVIKTSKIESPRITRSQA